MGANLSKPVAPSCDLYLVLELTPQATKQEIKKSYHRLALLKHPDKNLGDAANANAAFAKLQAAYETLSDEDRRRDYDVSRFEVTLGMFRHPAPHEYPPSPQKNPPGNTFPSASTPDYFLSKDNPEYLWHECEKRVDIERLWKKWQKSNSSELEERARFRWELDRRRKWGNDEAKIWRKFVQKKRANYNKRMRRAEERKRKGASGHVHCQRPRDSKGRFQPSERTNREKPSSSSSFLGLRTEKLNYV